MKPLETTVLSTTKKPKEMTNSIFRTGFVQHAVNKASGHRLNSENYGSPIHNVYGMGLWKKQHVIMN